MAKQKWPWFMIALVVLAGLTLLPLSVIYACSPAPNGYVFADTIVMDSATLPVDVTFEHQSLYQMTFTNNSAETVYVLADPTLLRDSWPEVNPPPDIAARVPEDQIIAIALAPDESLDLRRSDAFFPGFNPDAYFDYDTPEEFEGLPVPDDIESQITIISGGQEYEVAVAISYVSNPDYDPQGFARGVEACAQINETAERTAQVAGVAMALPVIAIAVCGVLVAVGGGVGVVIYLMRRRA